MFWKLHREMQVRYLADLLQLEAVVDAMEASPTVLPATVRSLLQSILKIAIRIVSQQSGFTLLTNILCLGQERGVEEMGGRGIDEFQRQFGNKKRRMP